MLGGFFDNMHFFEWHCGRRRRWCFVLVVIDKELIRLSMMSPLLFHLNAWLPLRVFLEATLIRPPFLSFSLIIELWLVAINPLKLFSILLCQTLKHFLLSFINHFTNSPSWTLISTVSQPCILSLFQTVRALIVYTNKALKVKGSCMAFIKSALLKDCVGWDWRVSYKLKTRVFCKILVYRTFSC